MSLPTRALKIEDLPEPVAPASATTVWPPCSPGPLPELGADGRARARPASGKLPVTDLDGRLQLLTGPRELLPEGTATVAAPRRSGLIGSPL